MRNFLRLIRVLWLVALIVAPGIAAWGSAAQAEVYQYALPAKSVEGKEITAFLWVPPNADRLRGALVGGQTLIEQTFAADPVIRQACADEKLAIVFFSPPLDALFDYKEKNAGELLQQTLDALALHSGYRELSHAPLFSFGHSVSTIFARNVAFWKPSRVFGVLLFKGGNPSTEEDGTILGVPVLVIKGQFEEFGPGPSGALREFEDRQVAWQTTHKRLLALRAADDRCLVSLLVDPGGSHFAWSTEMSPVVAMFIRKAAQQRIPEWPVDPKESVVCRDIDPKSGALSHAERGKPPHAAAKYDGYQGEPAKSFWHLDAELARACDAYHANKFDKQPQFVTFADPNSGKPIFVGHDLRLKLNPVWVRADTFKIAGTFLDQAPDKYPKVDGAVGHADGPIQFRKYAGTVEPVDHDAKVKNAFRVTLDGRGTVRAELLAYHPGDAKYRYAEQQGRVALPAVLKNGKPQKITFAPLGSMKLESTASSSERPGSPRSSDAGHSATASPIKLSATSDSGLPVRFYVESGPAVIENDMLKLSEVPKLATFPLKINVVAYQYGSAVEPLVQSAEMVRQVVEVTK